MTPQIDKLAYAGMNFRQAFSECPVCVPARRIHMTGRNPFGVHMNVNRDSQPFPEGPKLAECFTRAGWQTFAAGKLHTAPQRNRIGFEDVALNEEGRRQGDLRRDDYEAFLEERGLLHQAYSHGLGNNEYGVRMSPLPEECTTTHWTAQRAMEFIERRDPTRPFFLYVSFDKPHPPIVPPASYYGLYEAAIFPAPAMGAWLGSKLPSRIAAQRNVNHWDDIKDHPLFIPQTLRGFAAMITHIDSMIGQLLGTLREAGVLADTWVVFTSDHGDQLFDHGAFAKGDFFRGSCNIPFLIQPPARWREANGLAPESIDRSHAVGLADLMPTLLEAAGIPVPEGLDGESLLPLLRGEGGGFRPVSFGHCGEVYGATDGRWKYQWFADNDLELLFDTEVDPHECVDRSTSDARERDRLRSALIGWLQAHGDPQAADGDLKPMGSVHNLAAGRSINHWNNRGRH